MRLPALTPCVPRGPRGLGVGVAAPQSRSAARWRTAVAAALVVGLYAPIASAYSTGVTTQLFGPTGCNQCHFGGSTPIVDLSGPTTVAPSSSNTYTLRITASGAQTKAGLNVSATAGTLTTGGSDAANTQVLVGSGNRSEITHTAPKAASNGVTTFTFLWTAPTAAAIVQMTAWGNAVNGNATQVGDAAASSGLTITVVGEPTPTPPSLPTATATATAGAAACVGDCDGDGFVTVNEIITGVNIALGSEPLSACPSYDRNGDGLVTIDELLTAVNFAATSCPR